MGALVEQGGVFLDSLLALLVRERVERHDLVECDVDLLNGQRPALGRIGGKTAV